jgi:hypothetical protein
MAKLRNPNPEMPGAYATPYSREEYNAKAYPPGLEGHGHGADHSGPAHDSHSSKAPQPEHQPHASLGKILFGGNS